MGLKIALRPVGLTIGGLVCHQSEQQFSSLFLHYSGSRFLTELGCPGCVRLSAQQGTQMGNPEVKELPQVHDDPDHTLVRETALVPRSLRTKQQCSKKSAKVKRPLAPDL